MLFAIQSLVTISILAYAAVAAAADLNKTHATNPLWGGHARFHVVWQVFTHIGVGVVALVLVWVPLGSLELRLVTAMSLTFVVLVGFFVSALAMPLYDGRLADPNGYPQLAIPIGRRRYGLDLNVLLFGTAMVVLATAALLTVTNGGFPS
ncbi:hypothetical protein CH254_24275 [Rhodococcus sp. 06-412-2C]|uniref:hypothetical protein n=1 Tax=unclassified Rhodococcus (in: high G+C Gram-positive bacteria) TaxID=192944 RepID=UPI000B9BF7B5|nr:MULTISPECIES: hypothetical protein [unclassified Rhodococcus (in: high G+C Gram-positive bacteria)]OZC84000.1 hypothetical protein CH254_24275 [Rhodococcus sp. 06-412-2C]OZC94186.1 hypothetical protein CH279_22360 [Rhodococcus sp. 06-412-2B]